MPHTAPSILTEEYLDSLPIDRLIDLLLHKSNLFVVSVNTKVGDSSYHEELKEDISKIHAAIKSRSNGKAPNN